MLRRSYNNLNVLEVIKKEIKFVQKSLDEIEAFYNKDLRSLDRLSDKIAEVGGSWAFILFFFAILGGWIIFNTIIIIEKPLDPYPFILLNLMLSCLAAIQAPIILMSQSRAAKRDQYRVELDLEKDLRDLHIDQGSHKILLELKKDIIMIKQKLKIN
ncbi:DUF1003 domain-containing protein [Candidatus Woesearchaeota archaeon]|nr:DUF1003 domain-containing protein [Candidatus Woesearchaeota archaeon]